MSRRGEVGELGEVLAVAYLERGGYGIIDRNYRKKHGEIDIVAKKGGVLHFVEVKAGAFSREMISRENRLDPTDNATRRKMRKVVRTAESFMLEHDVKGDIQIDLVVVYMDMRTRRARCVLYEQVVE